MSHRKGVRGSLYLLALFYALSVNPASCSVLTLQTNNWTISLTGEWLIEFYAPWCPACREFATVFKRLSETKGLSTSLAAVDITQEPLLGFLFFVKQLPTLYHIKDAEIRLYDQSRNLSTLQHYLKESLYVDTAPVPWHYSPSSTHMRVLLKMLDLSMMANKVHQNFVSAGYPSWMSFIMIAVAVIVTGALCGLAFVMFCDCFCPPRPQILRYFGKGRRPPPIIIQENDSDQDSVVADSNLAEGKPKESGDTGSGKAKVATGEKPKSD